MENKMMKKEFQGKELGLLGFGAMRLPVDAAGVINEEEVRLMVKEAIAQGVNYFDTAWPYHNGESERVMGRVLKEYDRESFYLATKFPGHQISSHYDPKAVFEEQLRKCQVDYFDFYLLHNVYEKSKETYLDPKWGILEYFKEQKRLGKIRHLGFSTHGGVEFLKEFLDEHGKDMEFCQIQLNYLDWTLQDAKGKVELLKQYNIPVWVMEPVRGGRLVNLSKQQSQRLMALRPEESIASWGFRFLQGIDNVTMILSGMSNLTQMQDNLKTFCTDKPLSKEEIQVLLDMAEEMKNSIPCTGCRYCTEGCPMGLNIPMMLEVANEIRFSPSVNASMRIEFLSEDKKPSACIGCGACSAVCPQNIDIPAALKELDGMMKNMPSWKDISRQREEAQK